MELQFYMTHLIHIRPCTVCGRSPTARQRGSATSGLIFVMLLGSVIWLVTLMLGFANGLMASAGFLVLWALIRVWPLVFLAVLLGGVAWLIMYGSTLLNVFF
ncbi:Uncharacterised protein [Halioglobus japonicus]|nr:Uncharacterised protein [Halioglobus japonicus]